MATQKKLDKDARRRRRDQRNGHPRGGNMTFEAFIRRYRKEIDATIKVACYDCQIDDEERRLWVLNDEGLYNWARSKGVDI